VSISTTDLPRASWPLKVMPYQETVGLGIPVEHYDLCKPAGGKHWVEIGTARRKGDAYLWANALEMYRTLEIAIPALEACLKHLPSVVKGGAHPADAARAALNRARAVYDQVRRSVFTLCPVCEDVDRPIPEEPFPHPRPAEHGVIRCERCKREVHEECSREVDTITERLCSDCAREFEEGDAS